MRSLLFLVLLQISAMAGSDLKSFVPFPGIVYPSDGKTYYYSYRNYGPPIYIVRVRFSAYPVGNYDVQGTIEGDITRGCDQAELSRIGYVVSEYTMGAGTQGTCDNESFEPNYFLLNTGDTLTLDITASNIGGDTVIAGAILWYTLTP